MADHGEKSISCSRISDDAIADLKSREVAQVHRQFPPGYSLGRTVDIWLNWFDDERWQTIINNFQVLAKVAEGGGIKGLIFDPEPYGYKLFEYPDQRQQLDRSFEDYTTMARQRGRQVMTAIASSMPKVVILSLYAYSAPHNYLRTGRALADVPYGLLPAFYDGVLEVMPHEGRLIDGYEPAYFFKRRSQFLEGYKKIAEARTLSTFPDLYEKKVSAGFGLWIDYKRNPNYFTPKEFETAVRDALEISDEYVWIYSNGPRFFPPAGVSPSYIEALASARGPRKP